MMVPRTNLQCSRKPRPPSMVLAVVLMTWYFFLSVTGADPPTHLRGEVGGKVTFFCTSNKQKMLAFLYFQKGDTLVAAYHASRDIPNSVLPHSHSAVNRTERTVDMWALKVSDSGEYTCHVRYNDSDTLYETITQLSVTANYSIPTLSVLYDNDSTGCLVTCSSYGGYPGSEVKWNVSADVNTSSGWWTVVNSTNETDFESELVNSSSSVYFNCSGPPQSLSCSVGGATSDRLTVCEREAPPEHSAALLIAPVCLGVVIATGAVLLWKYRKSKNNGPTGAAKPDEVIVLKGQNEGQGDPECCEEESLNLSVVGTKKL